MRKLIAQKLFRIGLQSLWRNWDGTYYVSISNRSYHSSVRIPIEKVPIWKKVLS